jgi:hypothetical protein
LRGQKVYGWAVDAKKSLLPTVNITGDNHTIRVSKRCNSFIIEAIGIDLSRFAFGWVRTDGQKVIIADGIVEGRFGYMPVAGAEVNVGGNETAKHLIIVTGNESGGAIAVESVLESSYGGDSGNQWKRVLYRVYLSGTTPVMDMIGDGVGGVVL